MTEKQKIKAEKQQNFDAWVQTIDERIYDWFSYLEKDIKQRLDYSIDSLNVVEEYLVSKYSLQDFRDQQNKNEIDAAASYIIKVFELNWPKAKYVIELDDIKNILYNRPAIITQPKIGMAFSPYQILPSTINLRRIGGFKKILETIKNKYHAKYGEQE